MISFTVHTECCLSPLSHCPAQKLLRLHMNPLKTPSLSEKSPKYRKCYIRKVADASLLRGQGFNAAWLPQYLALVLICDALRAAAVLLSMHVPPERLEHAHATSSPMSSCAAVSMASVVAGTPATSGATALEVPCPPCWLAASSWPPSGRGSSQGWTSPLGGGSVCT